MMVVWLCVLGLGLAQQGSQCPPPPPPHLPPPPPHHRTHPPTRQVDLRKGATFYAHALAETRGLVRMAVEPQGCALALHSLRA